MTAPDQKPLISDVHAHAITDAAFRALSRETPSIGLRLTPIDDRSMILEIGGVVQNPFPRSALDLDLRFADLASAGIDMQVVSPSPHFFLSDEDAAVTAATSSIVNDELIALADANPARFLVLEQIAIQLAVEVLGRSVNDVIDAELPDRAPDIVPRDRRDIHGRGEGQHVQPVLVFQLV